MHLEIAPHAPDVRAALVSPIPPLPAPRPMPAVKATSKNRVEPHSSSGQSDAHTRVNARILIIDDNAAIHADFRKVLVPDRSGETALLVAEAALFGEPAKTPNAARFEVHSAFQGQEGFEKLKQAQADGRPFALAFVDVRMPPGWDGIQTVSRLWEVQPELQVVLCTAYSDYSWDEMLMRLGSPDNLLILKKPFDNVEVLQLAHALTRKWELNCEAKLNVEHLAKTVAERTIALETANAELALEIKERFQVERQFRHAQKMEAIGQLAAGVAHDFNNVLTVIHGHASMLSMRLGNEGPHAKSLLEIRRASERAAGLVRQLLAFSRKQILQFRSVELNDVIQSLSGMLRQLVGEQIALETRCGAGLPAIYADRGMVEQILMNLAVNARDAMPRGGRIILESKIATLDSSQALSSPDARVGHFVCLTVSDTGCGMDAETLTHLFEPFFTTKEVGKGTGLGLATVYGIVKQHRGWVEVTSAPGVGSTFRIYFPVSDQAGQRTPEFKDEMPPHKGSEIVLIAEDEAPLREMIGEMLRLQGYRVLSADSGPAALKLVAQTTKPVDLLMTDLVMPGGMLGTELATRLKSSNPQLKVIYTTGYSPGASGNGETLREGINFIPKPYSPSKLAQLIRACLDNAPAAVT